jgi:hypothetical protein
MVWFEPDSPVLHEGAPRLEARFGERASRRVVPEHQGKAIDTLLNQATYDVVKDQQVLHGDQLRAGG